MPAKKVAFEPDKFMMRLPLSVHAAIKTVAKANGRSLNAEISYALSEWLDEGSDSRAIHRSLVDSIGLVNAAVAFAKVERLSSDGREVKFCCRLGRGQRSILATKADPLKDVSMNSYSIDVLIWWIHNYRETRSLLALYKNPVLPLKAGEGSDP